METDNFANSYRLKALDIYHTRLRFKVHRLIEILIGNFNHPSHFRLRRFLTEQSLYNNSPSGVFQDMIEDLMERPEGAFSGLGNGALFGNYLE